MGWPLRGEVAYDSDTHFLDIIPTNLITSVTDVIIAAGAFASVAGSVSFFYTVVAFLSENQQVSSVEVLLVSN